MEEPARSAAIDRAVSRHRRRTVAAALGATLLVAHPATLVAQTLTPDPGAWRPLAYSDLRKQTRREATYIDIWKDAIDANNAAYAARGDRRFAGGNAPATEAHFVIWSSKRSVVISMLNTAPGCSLKAREEKSQAVIKLCPMRVAIYDRLRVRTLEAGWGCFIEPAPGAPLDPSASAAYGAYDVATKTAKIGLIVNHRAVDGCSFNIPIARE
jgi:hypothetical protein